MPEMNGKCPEGYLDMTGLPMAHKVKVMWCRGWELGECLHPHVILFDGAGKPVASFVVPPVESDGSGFVHDLVQAVVKSALRRNDMGPLLDGLKVLV